MLRAVLRVLPGSIDRVESLVIWLEITGLPGELDLDNLLLCWSESVSSGAVANKGNAEGFTSKGAGSVEPALTGLKLFSCWDVGDIFLPYLGGKVQAK